MRKIETQLVDDLDGAPADTTIPFTLDGVAYEIDLTDTHAAELRAALAPWIAAARRTGYLPVGQHAPRAPRSTGPARVDRAQTQAMRRWLRDHGWDIADRGRIPEAAKDAYHQGVAA